MKKCVMTVIAGCLVSNIDAKLRIRQQDPIWRPEEYCCWIDDRIARMPTSAAEAEETVRALEVKANEEYDKGTYQAEWAKKYRRPALEIQSHLGYTVPDGMPEDEEDPVDL